MCWCMTSRQAVEAGLSLQTVRGRVMVSGREAVGAPPSRRGAPSSATPGQQVSSPPALRRHGHSAAPVHQQKKRMSGYSWSRQRVVFGG